MTELVEMSRPSRLTPSTEKWSAYVDLFLVSFFILFLELACIRWFGSTVVYLTFFTNIVLIATFLGMSVGCLSASSGRDWTQKLVPMLVVAAMAACTIFWFFSHGRVQVDVGGQGSPQQVYFDTEYQARDITSFMTVPIEAVAILFFYLLTFAFVGAGQFLGREFNRAPDRLRAYIANIGGSLAGTACFAIASYLCTAPVIWFAIALGIWIYLSKGTRVRATVWSCVMLLTVGFSGLLEIPGHAQDRTMLWSPYYKIVYTPATGLIETNNLSHQQIVDVRKSGPAYNLPYLLNRDSGGPPFDDVLVVGAGSGNDVSAALAYGAKHVDAVEIDPLLYGLGRAHPDQPYQDPRVTVYTDDGRSFIRKSQKKYDLIVYALVDSLVLHSGYSSIRLESFLFTQQAFDDIAAHLKPDGLFVAYNYFRQGWIVGRIDKMAQSAFGAKPLVMSLPRVESISSTDNQFNRLTMVLSSAGGSRLTAIQHRFETDQFFWVNKNPSLNGPINGFSSVQPKTADVSADSWLDIAPARVNAADITTLPSDDWPFLYLRGKLIPALNLRSMALIAALSLLIMCMFTPVKLLRPNWQMFFLGAGFMLLETKSVVHMALLFGATWIVNSVVFFAILVMILASNFYVLSVKPEKLAPYYALLFASLLLNILVPISRFLALQIWAKTLISCVVVFVPIFFAGVVFGVLFRDSSQPDVDFGSNIGGAILGGLCESLSLILGFSHLLIVAIVFYLLSAVLGRRVFSRLAGA